MNIISSTAYWSANVSRAIVMATLLLAPLLVGYFALSLAWLEFLLGAPMDPALDFTVEASVALTDKLLLLALVAAFFALISLVARWFICEGKSGQVDADSFSQGHLFFTLLAFLFEPAGFALRRWLHPRESLRHPYRRHFRLRFTPAAMTGAVPLQI